MTKGFFTDTTLCIGCKACEVACKQWNELPEDGYNFTGNSYDNTMHLGASTWRHVAFIEKPAATHESDEGAFSWLFSSDVCKHCSRAGCLESCPTGAIIRTEFGSVFVQPDICNGCGYCIVNCPFGVIDRREDDGRAWKCTLCYDRLKEDLTPACAKACPRNRFSLAICRNCMNERGLVWKSCMGVARRKPISMAQARKSNPAQKVCMRSFC